MSSPSNFRRADAPTRPVEGADPASAPAPDSLGALEAPAILDSDTLLVRPSSTIPPRALSMQGLREAFPEEYQRWVRWGVLAAFVGYGAAVLVLGFGSGFDQLHRHQETYALLLIAVALLVEQSGRPVSAAYLTLGTSTVEVLSGFLLETHGIRAGSVVAVPVLVLGAGLLLGMRAAYAVAFLGGFGAPALALLGGHLGFGPGIPDDALVNVSAVVSSAAVSATLLHAFLGSFDKALSRSWSSERRAADLIRSAPDGIIVATERGIVETANSVAASLLGKSRKQLVGASLGSLPVYRSRGRGELDARLLEGVGPVEFVVLGSDRTLEVRAQSIMGSDGQTSRLLLLRDITERRQAEQREQELADQLQHSQKLEAVGQLAGGVAHDFNNLLTVVAGYADFIEDFSDPGARSIADELRATYRRGVALTRQLLAFARRDVTSPRPIDVTEVVESAKNLLERLAGEQVRIDYHLAEPCMIVADPGQIEQVLMNLVSNARDAMPSGGNLGLGCRSDGESVVLSVSDTGEGIDDAVRRRMFEPFFTTKPRGKGTGLGLSTVHGIVTKSGGVIEVESAPGRGTRFTLRFPKTDQLPRTVGTPRPPGQVRTGRGTILLAEDDEQTRRFVTRVLTDAGFDVRVAHDGAEALSLAVKMDGPPDLVVSDVMMPGMTGVEFIERLRRHHPNTPILLTSGYSDHILDSIALDLSEDLLQKPFGRDDLLARVHAKLGKARGEQPS